MAPAVGPGWSSFAVRGALLYTQEQRGEHEIVGCYKLSTGEPVWRHRDPVRFWESNGGAGPRGTPAVSKGRVYSFGATGILNALDADTGALRWTRNVATDTGRRVPEWGFSSSPLAIDDIVVVAAAGTLSAYDLATGKQRWRGPSYGGSYSSPHPVTVDGVRQILLLGGPGAVSVSPENGAVLWEHKWAPGAIVQPAVTGDGDILINTIVATGGLGIRRSRSLTRAVRGASTVGLARAQAVSSTTSSCTRACLRLRQEHSREHRSCRRHAQVEGRALRQRPARAPGGPGPAAVVSDEGELALVGATPGQ